MGTGYIDEVEFRERESEKLIGIIVRKKQKLKCVVAGLE
jgi:hypothetical protein